MITAVTILIQHPHTGLYLGVSRKDDPNAFGLPGGKVDPGETPLEAAVRELHEETGLVGNPDTAREVFRRVCEGGKDGVEFFVATYVMTTTGEISTQEAGRVAWITKDTLFDGPFGAYNRNLFDQVTLCHHCRGTGTEWQSTAECSVCDGDIGIVKQRVMLLDDYRKPENINSFRYAEHHYKWDVCRTNLRATVQVEASPKYDLWCIDYDLGEGRTTYPFLDHAIRHAADKWPDRIDVVSEHDKAMDLALYILQLNPSTMVTLRGMPVKIPQPETMVYHIYKYEEFTKFVGPESRSMLAAPKPWTKDGKKTIQFRSKKGKK